MVHISVDLGSPIYLQQHVVEPDGTRARVSDGYPSTERQKALCEALAPFVELPVNDETRSDEDRVKIMGWLADGRHVLRVHGDIGVTWRIMVTLRETGEHAKGETAIAIYNMKTHDETVTVH